VKHYIRRLGSTNPSLLVWLADDVTAKATAKCDNATTMAFKGQQVADMFKQR
jgi:hypothetical protein